MSSCSNSPFSANYSVSFRLSVRPTKSYGGGDLVNCLCKFTNSGGLNLVRYSVAMYSHASACMRWSAASTQWLQLHSSN